MSLEAVLLGGFALLFLFIRSTFVASFYRKRPPNQAMIISGMGCEREGQQFRIHVGGGDVVVPVIQQVSFLSLEVMKIKMHGTHASREDVVHSCDAQTLFDSFSDTGNKVKEKAEPELTAMGLSCSAFTIQSVTNETGVSPSGVVKSPARSQIL